MAIGLFAQQQDLDLQYATELLKPGTSAPDFTLTDIGGNSVSLKDFRGRKVVLVFWASWCPDCRKEIPDLKSLEKKYAGDKVVFVSISLDHDAAAWKNCVKENGMTWLQLSEGVKRKESKVATDYKVKWIPSLYVIGPDGKVMLGTVMLSKVEQALRDIR